MKAAIVLPSRWDSTRFPGKPLTRINGKPLLWHTWMAADRARVSDPRIQAVIVATDDERIRRDASEWGATVIMTSPSSANGTERVWDAMKNGIWDAIVNWQGDALLAESSWPSRLLDVISAGTTATPVMSSPGDDPEGSVFAVLDHKNRALYFSRSPIPAGRRARRLLHIGMYAYGYAALDAYASKVPSYLEETEHLEQLRFLSYNIPMSCVQVPFREYREVNTPEDVPVVETLLRLP